VENLEAEVAFYERLVGESASRFSFSGAQLAAVGPFLIFQAPGALGDRLAGVAATLTVDDLVEQERLLRELGAEVIAPPAPTPNGQRMIARHPDGSVFEYAGPARP
jgi:predicted enzyme related to lactoylglutathione lyase